MNVSIIDDNIAALQEATFNLCMLYGMPDVLAGNGSACAAVTGATIHHNSMIKTIAHFRINVEVIMTVLSSLAVIILFRNELVEHSMHYLLLIANRTFPRCFYRHDDNNELLKWIEN